MGAALGGVLAVDKAVIIVAVLTVDMSESGLEVLVLDVDDGIEGLAFHVVFQEVEETVFGVITFTVIVETESAIEVAVVPYATFYVLAYEMVVAEKFGVGYKLDKGAG